MILNFYCLYYSRKNIFPKEYFFEKKFDLLNYPAGFVYPRLPPVINFSAFSGISRPAILIIPWGSRMTSGVLFVGDNIFGFLYNA
jgi:hypothetical protein